MAALAIVCTDRSTPSSEIEELFAHAEEFDAFEMNEALDVAFGGKPSASRGEREAAKWAALRVRDLARERRAREVAEFREKLMRVHARELEDRVESLMGRLDNLHEMIDGLNADLDDAYLEIQTGRRGRTLLLTELASARQAVDGAVRALAIQDVKYAAVTSQLLEARQELDAAKSTRERACPGAPAKRPRTELE